MDSIDREILRILDADGRITATELAKQIRLSLSATSERLRHLRASGVITRFAAIVDPIALGRPIEALIDVRFGPGAPSQMAHAELDQLIAAMPGVIDAMHLTGRFDTQLRVAAKDVDELDKLLVHLKDDLGADETNTRLILRSIEGFPRAAN